METICLCYLNEMREVCSCAGMGKGIGPGEMVDCIQSSSLQNE